MLRRLVLSCAALAVLTGCEAPEPRPLPDAADLPLRGTKPLAPLEKVGFTMPDTEGEPYDFRAETDGSIALLFFGYTYCPDICPVSMATLARGLDALPPEERDRIEVVFVTVDPERDTPERLRGWLSAFDSSFVGIRGSVEEIEEALAFYRYPPPERSADGQVYTVGHPALIYAFTPDGLGRAMYGPETSARTWTHDLGMLAGYPWAAWSSEDAAGTQGAGTQGAGTQGQGGMEAAGPTTDGAGPSRAPALGVAGDVLVLDAYAPAPVAGGTEAAVYLQLRNQGPLPDTLVAVASTAAERGSLHDMVQEGGMMRMVPLATLPLPPGESVVLAPGRRHGMLEGVAPGSLAPGDAVEVTLTFSRGGTVTVPLRVIEYGAAGG